MAGKPQFEATEEDGIWTVFNGDMPIGRALTKRDADSFVDALNGTLGDDLRDRLLAAVKRCRGGVLRWIVDFPEGIDL